MIHLDTSFLIRALGSGSMEGRKLRAWIAEGEAVAMSAVAWAEFLCGPLDEAELGLATEIVGQRRAFAAGDAATAARLFNDSGRCRGSFVDCLIAAGAVEAGAAVATVNEADFRRFERLGLTIAEAT